MPLSHLLRRPGSWLALSGLVVSLSGCADRDPAESLGLFGVSGTLTEQCSDSGLLAVPESKDFLVELSRINSALHWMEGGRRLIGDLDPDGGFVVEEYLRVDMRQETPDADLPSCVIERWDEKIGTLFLDDAGNCSGFTGQLIHTVVPTASSDCSDLLQGQAAIADELPCSIVYDVEAAPYEQE